MHPDFLYDSSQVVGAGDSARLRKNPFFYGNLRQIRYFPRADRVVRPSRISVILRSSVGVDAHIDPAVQSVFMKIQCKFVGAPRGDVGIAPYASYRYIGQVLFSQSEIAITAPARTRGRYTRRGSRAAGRPSEAPARRGSSRSSLPSPRPARQRLAAGQRACGSG